MSGAAGPRHSSRFALSSFAVPLPTDFVFDKLQRQQTEALGWVLGAWADNSDKLADRFSTGVTVTVQFLGRYGDSAVFG